MEKHTLTVARGVAWIESHGANLFIPEQERASHQFMITIVGVGGETHIVVSWSALEGGARSQRSRKCRITAWQKLPCLSV